MNKTIKELIIGVAALTSTVLFLMVAVIALYTAAGK